MVDPDSKAVLAISVVVHSIGYIKKVKKSIVLLDVLIVANLSRRPYTLYKICRIIRASLLKIKDVRFIVSSNYDYLE